MPATGRTVIYGHLMGRCSIFTFSTSQLKEQLLRKSSSGGIQSGHISGSGARKANRNPTELDSAVHQVAVSAPFRNGGRVNQFTLGLQCHVGGYQVDIQENCQGEDRSLRTRRKRTSRVERRDRRY